MKFLRIIILAISIFLQLNISFSQASIIGSIYDKNEALTFANVLLYNSVDSIMIKGNLSDEDGNFQFENIETGQYYLLITMLGYTDHFSESFIINENKNLTLDRIQLEEGIELEEIQVTARKALFEQKVDRLVVNVANTITMAGGTALEALEKSPGILVNKQNDLITMMGKDGVVLMINGKESQLPPEAVVQMLAGMSADNIEKIELITSPPSNFDAEGNAGFINIVLKENTSEGWNGNYSLSAGYSTGENLGANIFLNYRKNKLNIFGSYSFSRDVQLQYFELSRTLFKADSTLANQVISDRDPIQQNHNARIGLDYNLSTNTNIGALLTVYDKKWTMEAINKNTSYLNSNLTDSTSINNVEKNQWKHFGGNVYLQQKISDSQNFNLDFDYLFYIDDNPTQYDIDYFYISTQTSENEISESTKNTPIKIMVAKMDYTNNLSPTLLFDLGLKASLSKFENDVAYSILNNNAWENVPRFTNSSNLEESKYAGYSSLKYNFKEKNELKVGLRYEYTDSKLETNKEGIVVDRQFGVFFPSIFYSYKITEQNSFNFSYTKRITRPTFNDMAPFVIFIEPKTYFFGNAAIQPAISDNFKVDLKIKSYMLSLQYSVQDSTISRFQSSISLDNNEQLIRPINLSQSELYTANLSIPFYFANWCEMQNNILLSHQKNVFFTENQGLNKLQNNSLTTNSTISFLFPLDVSAEISFAYFSKQLFGSNLVDPFYFVNFGIQKKLKREGDVIRLSVNDVFNTIKWEITADFDKDLYALKSTWDFSQTLVRFSYSSTFGNKRLKAAKIRNVGSEEERKRVN